MVNFTVSCDEQKKAQVIKQCSAIGYLSLLLCTIIESGNPQIINQSIDAVGEETAHQLQALCSMLGSLDGIEEGKDDFIRPIVAEARETWPVASKWECH